MRGRVWCRMLVVVGLTVGVASCSGSSNGDGSLAVFVLNVTPEFVQGIVPGARTGVIVAVEDPTPSDTPVRITATADGATVVVEPDEILAGEVAEVWLVAEPTAAERPIDLVVTAQRGDLVSSRTVSTTVFAWEDDRGAYAGELLDLFAGWLAEHEPDLGIPSADGFEGSFVAPGLLVVSHYLYLSDAWELGLSWHVMVAPDDWAEIYLRPRGEPVPTLAFRLASQTAALQESVLEISPVDPPVEVMR